MADSFELNYKEDGDILNGSDVRENISFALMTSINYAIDGATTTNQDNLKALGGSDIENTTGAGYSSGNDTVIGYFGACYDAYDSSVDATKWGSSGTSSITETTVSIRNHSTNTASGYLITNGSGTSLDLNDATDNTAIKFYSIVSGNGTWNARLYISDGTSRVQVGGDKQAGVVEIVVNNSTSTFSSWFDGVQVDTNVSLAALSNYYIETWTSSTGIGANGRYYLYHLGKYEQATAYEMIFEDQTITGTMFVGKSAVSDPYSGTIGTHSYSINDGGAWTTYTTKTLIEVGAYTGLKHKFQYTSPASITANAENVPELTKLAYYYS